MAISIAYIPKGATSEQKKILIERTKEACMKGLGLGYKHSFVYLQEVDPECMDETAVDMKCLFVFTTLGKTPEGKNEVCRRFDEACAEAFGENKGRTIVIFKEHGDDNAGSNGYLRPFVPNTK